MSDVIDKCVNQLADNLGNISNEDRAKLRQRIKGMVNRMIQSKDAQNIEDGLQKALDQLSQEMTLQAKLAKRNAYLNFMRRREVSDYIRMEYAANPLRGLEAMMVGVQSIKNGSRMSAALVQDSLGRRYTGGLIRDLIRAGHEKTFASGVLDEDIAEYMFLKDTPAELAKRKFQSSVVEIGDLLYKYQDLARRNANDAGAYIREMKGYITKQSHNMIRVHAAGFDDWYNDIGPRLDMDRMREELDVKTGETDEQAMRRYMKNVYDAIVSGDYMRHETVTSGMNGNVNIGRAMSRTRSLHFKSGKDWFQYNNKYGSGTMRETVFWGLHKSAHQTGLMQVFGPNAEDNIKRTIQNLKGLLDEEPERKAKFLKSVDEGGKLHNMYRNLTGEAMIPVNNTVAKYSAMARAIETLGSLGGAVISAFSDLPIFAAQYQRQYGSFMEGMTVGMRSLMDNVGRSKSEQREMAAMMGVYSDSVLGTLAARFGGDAEIPGKVANTVNTFFKINGLHWWTDTLKQGFTSALSGQLAARRTSSFADLPADVKDVLGFFKIDESDWDIFRQTEVFNFRGNELLTVDRIDDLPDEVIANSIAADIQKIIDRKPNNADAQIAAAIREKRRSVSTKWQGYFLDRAEHAVITPDRKTNTILNQGTRPGTAVGELVRMMTQFKTFPTAVLQKGLGAEMFARGVEYDDMKTMASLGQGLKHEYTGVLQLMFTMSLFGYMSLSAKDALKGQKPRDPTDPKTVLASLTQGGSIGLLGDALFNPIPSRVGGGFWGIAGGPVLGDVAKTYDIYQGIMAGDDMSANAVRQAISLVPGNNLFYVKPALDYLLVHDLNEMMSPGYLRRAERRLEREQGVQYWLKPSEVAR